MGVQSEIIISVSPEWSTVSCDSVSLTDKESKYKVTVVPELI